MMDYTDADKHVAMVKLHILRDKYREGWIPKWRKDDKKYCVCRVYADNRSIHVIESIYAQAFLSFKSMEIAKNFAINFRDLIEEAGDLI